MYTIYDQFRVQVAGSLVATILLDHRPLIPIKLILFIPVSEASVTPWQDLGVTHRPLVHGA